MSENTDRLVLEVKKQDGTVVNSLVNVPVTDLVEEPQEPGEPLAVITPVHISAFPASNVNFSGVNSKNASSYQWSVSGNLTIIGADNGPIVTVMLPNDPGIPDLKVNLTVKNSAGKESSASATVEVKEKPNTVEKRILPATITVPNAEPGKGVEGLNDDDPNTRCSFPGVGTELTFTFNDPKIKSIDKAVVNCWHLGRLYKYKIGPKEFSCPPGRTETTDIIHDISDLNLDPSKIVVTGLGNDSSDFNSFRKFHFLGQVEIEPGQEPCNAGECRDVNTQLCRPLQTGERANVITGLCELIPQTGDEFSILHIGDDDVNNNAKKTHQQMKNYLITNKDTKPVKLIIHKGDSSYREREEQYVAQHRSVWSPEELKLWRFSKGNHDTSSSETKTTQWVLENYFTRYLRNTLKEPNDSTYRDKIRENLWIEAEIIEDYVYFINMDSEDLRVEFRDTQFNFVKEKLEEAKRLRAEGKIKWIVCAFHKPFFTLKSSHSPYTSVRFMYKDIFFDAQVDIMLHGHNHNYQAWKPMIPNESDANGEGKQLFEYMPDGKTFNMSKPHGTIYDVGGDGSHEWNNIDDSGSGVANVQFYKDSGKFGFGALIFNKKTHRVKSQHIDLDGGLVFEYDLSRELDGGGGGSERADAKFPELIKKANPGEEVLLDGSLSKGVESWTLTQKILSTEPSVQLIDVETPKYSKKFVMPDTDKILLFELEVTDSEGRKDKDTISVSKSTGGGGTPNEIYNSSQDLNQNVTVDGNNFVPGSKVILTTRAGQGDKKFKVENGTITWTGVRTRIYNIFSKVVGVTQNAKQNVEIQFYARRTNSSEGNNISTKLGNHGTDGWDEANDWSFGGYGCSFGIRQIETKVEYFHNEHGESKDFTLSKPIPVNQFVGFRERWQTVKGKQEKVLNVWIEYPDDLGNWVHVIKDRIWGSWSKSGGPTGKKDTDGVRNGPYLGDCHHIWIRNNGVGTLTVKDISIRELQEAEL